MSQELRRGDTGTSLFDDDDEFDSIYSGDDRLGSGSDDFGGDDRRLQKQGTELSIDSEKDGATFLSTDVSVLPTSDTNKDPTGGIDQGPTPAVSKRDSLMQDLRRASQEFKKLMQSDQSDQSESEGSEQLMPTVEQDNAPSESEGSEKLMLEVNQDTEKLVPEVNQDIETDPAVVADLQSMSVKDLKAKARSLGITDEELDEAGETDKPKMAIIDLVVDKQGKLEQAAEAERAAVRAELEQAAEAEKAALRAELESKSLKELKAKAREVGLTEEDIEDAEEEDKPKQALIELIEIEYRIASEEQEAASASSLAMATAVSQNPMLKRQAEENERKQKQAEAKAMSKAKLQAQIAAEGFDGIPGGMDERAERRRQARKERDEKRAGEKQETTTKQDLSQLDGIPATLDERAEARKQAKKEREERRAAQEEAQAIAKGLKRPPKKKGVLAASSIRKSIEEVREAVKKVKEEEPPPPVIPGQGLLVTLVQARGLRNMDKDPGDVSDPYCTCEIPRKPKSKIETPVVWNNLSPVWNYTRQIVNYTENDMLKFCVWDKDYQTKQLLGKCDLKFAQYFPDGFEKWIPMATSLRPAPELLVKVEVLGLPEPTKREEQHLPRTPEKKKEPYVQYEFGRRVPHKGPEMSPRTQARFDAKRLVDSFDCWSHGLRGSDEFTELIPSKVEKTPQPKKDAYGPPPEALVAHSTFKQFLLNRAGNFSRAWRLLLDPDWHGKLTIIELGNKCREHGYHGNLNALWKAMDRAKRGWATLADIDAGTAEMLARFYTTLETRRRVEDRGRRNAAHARGEAEEPESEPGHGGTEDDGMQLMKCLDVDATRRLSKGEFCRAVQVLQLAKEEDGPHLFDMLCYASAAPTPSSAVVTEGELQWLHNVCEPFNLFGKAGKRGGEIPKKAPKVLSAHERLEARKQVLATKGRLRKVWTQDPAVFGRLYDDFERREDDYFQRVTEEPEVGKDAKTAEELEEVSNRLYEDAFTRNAKRDLEAEGHRSACSRRTIDPEVQARLTAGKKEPQLTKRQKALMEAAQLKKEQEPKKVLNMDRINDMLAERSKWLEKRERMREEAKAKQLKDEEEARKKPKETIADQARRNSLAKCQMRRLAAKLRYQAEKDGIELGELEGLNPSEAREKLQAIKKALRPGPGGKRLKPKQVLKRVSMHGLVMVKQAEEAQRQMDDEQMHELIDALQPEAPLPIPRKSVPVMIVSDPDNAYPHARTPHWIAQNEVRRARSAERALSPGPRVKSGSPRRLELPVGPAMSATDLGEALPEATETVVEDPELLPRKKQRPDPSIGPIKVFPMPKRTSTPPLSVWDLSDGEDADGELLDLGTAQDPLAKMRKRQAGAFGSATPPQRGRVGFDSPQKPFRPEKHTPVSREELMARGRQSERRSVTPRKSVTVRKSGSQPAAAVASSSAAPAPAATEAAAPAATEAAASASTAPAAPAATEAAPAAIAAEELTEPAPAETAGEAPAAHAAAEPAAVESTGPPSNVSAGKRVGGQQGKGDALQRDSTPRARAKAVPQRPSQSTPSRRPSQDATPPPESAPSRRPGRDATPPPQSAPSRRPSQDAAPPPESAPSKRPGRDATPPPQSAPSKRPSQDATPPPQSAPSKRPSRDATPPPRRPGRDVTPPPASRGGSIASASSPGHNASATVDSGDRDEAARLLDVVAGTEDKSLGMKPNCPPGEVMINEVTAGSWAAKAGIVEQSQIVMLNGKEVNPMPREEFIQTMKGRPLKLTIKLPEV